MHKMRYTPDTHILRMRERENKLASITSHVQETLKLENRAEWEGRAEDRSKITNATRRTEYIQAYQAADVNRRREKLAEKLFREEQELQQELLEQQLTPEQRKAAIRERALRLAQEKEAASAAHEAACAAQHFEENCDLLRTRISQQRVQDAVSYRQAQIEERRQAQLAQAAKDQRFLEILDEADRCGEERDAELAVARQDATHRCEELNRVQMERMQAQRESAAANQVVERIQLGEREARLAQEEASHRLADRLAAQELVADAERRYRQRQEEAAALAAEARLEREAAKEAAIAEDQEAAAAQLAARTARQQQDHLYRRQVSAMTRHQQEQAAAREAAIERQRQKVLEREDAEMAARAAARARLQAEVAESQRGHIQRRALTREQHHREVEEIRAQQEADLARLEAERDAARAAQQLEGLRLRQFLDQQNALKAQEKARQVQERTQHLAATARAEREHEAAVAEALSSARPANSYGRRKVDWYD